MAQPQQQTLALLKMAALMRATGASWAAVAAKVDRNPSHVRGWPSDYREQWEDLMDEAITQVCNDAYVESLAVLRQQLRAEKEDHGSWTEMIKFRAASCIINAVGRGRVKRVEHTGKGGGPISMSHMDMMEWSDEELVEEALRNGVVVPQSLIDRISGSVTGNGEGKGRGNGEEEKPGGDTVDPESN